MTLDLTKSSTKSSTKEPLITPDIAARLRAGVQYLETEPLRFEMSLWLGHSDTAPCGTEMCYAGAIIAALHYEGDVGRLWKRYQSDVIKFPQEAAELIGLPEERVKLLFYVESWPLSDAVRYYSLSRELAGAVRNEDAERMRELRVEQLTLLAEVVEKFISSDGHFTAADLGRSIES